MFLIENIVFGEDYLVDEGIFRIDLNDFLVDEGILKWFFFFTDR